MFYCCLLFIYYLCVISAEKQVLEIRMLRLVQFACNY